MGYVNKIFEFLAANIDIVSAAIYIILGGFIAYYHSNAKLQRYAAELIAEAEATFNTAKSGGARFAWVVGKLYDLVPLALKSVITKQMIERIVQGTFNSMAQYAKTQVDRLVDAVIPETEE